MSLIIPAYKYIRYNIGHIGISLGDLGLAYQAFKVAISVDPGHGEALNNIGVLEMRRQKFELARNCLSTSTSVSPQLFEPLYNSGKRAWDGPNIFFATRTNRLNPSPFSLTINPPCSCDP
jgi:tetratricopeptide (TPR) repeat protein